MQKRSERTATGNFYGSSLPPGSDNQISHMCTSWHPKIQAGTFASRAFFAGISKKFHSNSNTARPRQQWLVNLFLIDVPVRVLAQFAIRPFEPFRGTLIAFELPVKPGCRDRREFAAQILSVCSEVCHSGTPCMENWRLIDGFEVVHRAGISNVVDLGTGNVQSGNNDVVAFIFVAAAPNADGLYAFVFAKTRC